MFIVTIMMAVLIGIVIYKGYQNTHSVVMNEIHINHRSADRAGGSSLKILHLSDLHLENISICPNTLYHRVKKLDIDLVAVTGDFLDRKRSLPKLIPYLKVLNKLNPSYGSYAVFGNHDYVLKDKYFYQLKKILNDFGLKTLQNENDLIQIGNKRINIIGIDDYSTKRSNLKESYKGVGNGYNLVFTHDPNIVLSMKEEYHFDYLLSGHFHGGQIHWPKPYHLVKMGKLVKMNMVKGLHHYKERPFYINEGLGQTGVNIRIGSRPEITVHNVTIPEEVKEVGAAV
ncbi:putative MPP superfamily phosphohydrolase [Bacillus thermophilus]|uniref:MPP superfamily phosphohydrolase n=1 Tax=Siminovitchia thermophila TaxID=1245522 RepID=A0ABS2RDU6_9BACI|nr:metallophosphoesterase [Siminovitchia thermophila]MBM7717525.1 putative MPP superfamily phosphohydrolase [Siminovitchia thermophila]ONK22084.1 metallophosphoesterase [Bacillus sp. VT-16-64]